MHIFFTSHNFIFRVALLFPLLLIAIFLSSCDRFGSNSVSNTNLTDNSDTNIIDINPLKTSDHAFSIIHFSGSQICADCHNDITDSDGFDVSLETDWASTMMANSARDPLFRAKVASEVIRNPNLKSVIEEKCSRCHTPMANVESTLNSQTIALLPPGFLSPDHALFDAAMDGVSCTLCHQLENSENLGIDIGLSGNFTINTNRDIYGPFAAPFATPMINATGFTPVFATHVTRSEACSSCHTLLTDIVDATTGELTGEKFTEQATYLEWAQSSYSQATVVPVQSCQNCHMPETNGVKVSNKGAGVTAKNNFSKHYFVGANTYMLDILNTNKTALGITANNFEETIQRTRKLLTRAAEISVSDITNNAGAINFTVNITNNTGHKLPSGYPARRAYLHVTITDSNNTVVFESGKMNANGSIVGVDADANANQYEPHYDTITQSDQVQVYEAIMQDTNNTVTYTLLNAAKYSKDNRLLPEGFDKNTVTPDIAPDVIAMADNNFIAASDNVTYLLNIGGTAPYSVNVALNYQSVAYQYAQDLFKDEAKHEYIADYKTLHNAANIKKELIVEHNFSIE